MRRFLRRNFSATIRLALLVVVVVVVVGPGVVWAEQYEVIPGKGTEVVFDSRAPMEKFQGKTGQVLGWLTADLADLTSAVEMEVSVELASFDTGMGKRNTHMRENHFETDRFPLAVFRGGQVSGASAKGLAVGAMVELKLAGTLDLHGVTREMICDVTLTRPTADELRVEAHFPVLLPDHEISRPKFLMLKLAEDQQVNVFLSLKKES